MEQNWDPAPKQLKAGHPKSGRCKMLQFINMVKTF